jgi:hypothetical protein
MFCGWNEQSYLYVPALAKVKLTVSPGFMVPISSFMEGVLAGLDATGLSARLDPRPGSCCVARTAGR